MGGTGRTGIAVLLICLAAPSFAQSPNTAALVVSVTDQTGAVVPGARVVVVDGLTGSTREAASGANGTATIPALPVSGAYTISVSKPGFTSEEVHDIVLRAGETASIRVRLTPSGGASEVTVYGTAGGIRSDPQLGMRLDAQQIDDVPVLGRKVTSLPLLNAAFRSGKGTGDLFINATYFVTGAGGRREASYAVDGATGDEPWGRQTMFSTVPVGAVQEIQVLSNAFSSEFGWTSGTAVNVVTKSGTNVPHGEALYEGRPGGLQKSTATTGSTTIAPPDVPDVLHQISGAAGGAITPEKTFLFAAGDYTRQDRTAFFAPMVPPALLNGITSYVGNYRQGLVNARIDHKLNAGNTLMGRFNLDRFSDDNPQDVVSGITLPSAGRIFRRHTSSYQVNDTSIINASMLNEARFEYQHGGPITDFDPLTPSTQFFRPGVATEGESRGVRVWSDQAALSDTLSWTRGRQFLRIGGSLARHGSGGDGTEFGNAFTLGQFQINPDVTLPISQLTIGDATRYTQTFDFGVSTYTTRQWIYALFAQDSLRLRPDLTVDLGLRYDRQTFSDGKKNFEPRTGFAWHPDGDARTSVRGGYGLYATMLRANTDANFALGGPEGQFSYSVAPGQAGFPDSIAAVPISFPAGAALPARNITIRPGLASYYARFFDIARLTGYPDALVNPKSQVVSIGAERELARHLFVSADYVKQHVTDIDRTIDLNAPSLFVRTAPGQVRSAAAADATRPIAPVNNGFRSINAVVNLGEADYDGLQTMMRWQSERAWIAVSYTLSKATNTTELNGNAAGPNDFNQLGEEERGPSILDQRHRAVISGAYRLPFDITAGIVSSLASARPYNATTGVDNNGDGVLNDRPVVDGQVAGRYSFRGTPLYDTAVFAEGRINLRAGRSATLRAEVFNLFNHANILGRIGTYGDGTAPSPVFGTPSTGLANLDPARMVQFQLRFNF
jgi:carboxypeptidase family protein/TonB-dependent receptor-like protein